jgi:exopolysaccharide biosynthesis glucuronosyltransferase PssD
VEPMVEAVQPRQPSRKVLAVASSGGHWIQLMRLRPALAGHDLAFATSEVGYREDVAEARFYRFRDASRWDKVGLVRLLLRMAWILLRERPDVVITTGAAPGYFALRLGKWLGARTVWLDSLANAEEMSLSGKRVQPFADLWLTQWPEVARDGGPEFRGSVL